jgi:ribonuclease D
VSEIQNSFYNLNHDDLPPPVLITQPAALAQLAEDLSEEPILAVDTESNSLYAYREQVCLIQFSSPQTDYLVDPLALEDLTPLADLFANPHIEKIFHAAEYDLICLRRDYDFRFANLFDTMQAARILGRKAVGLGSLLYETFGVQLDKNFQRANWGKRPLTADQLTYARLDTHYLIPLRHHLQADLEQVDRWALAQEDFERLIAVNERLSENGGNHGCSNWHVKGANDLSPQQYAVLYELCQYRDRMARTLNRPLFKVMGDKTLLAVAEVCPSQLMELQDLHGMSPRQIKRHGKGLLQAVQRGLNSPPRTPARSPRPSDAYLARMDALRNWRKHTASKIGVESDIVLPRDLMFALAEKNRLTPAALSELLKPVPWRLDQYGGQILDVLRASSPKKGSS